MKCLKIFGQWLLIVLVIHIFISFVFSPEASGKYLPFIALLLGIGAFIYYREHNKKQIKINSKKSIKVISSSKYPLDENGFMIAWQTNKPIKVQFRIDSDPKMREHKIAKLLISPTGYDKLFCIGENNISYLVDEYDIDTKFLYKSKRYDTFDELLEKVLGTDKAIKIDELKTDYYEYLLEINEKKRQEEQEIYDKREESKSIIYSFPEKKLNFSIFGDYFDESKPPNNMKFTLLCNGLFGYPDNNEITGLVGINPENNKNVVIRINAIRTKVELEGKKYSTFDIIEILKNGS